MGERVRNHFNFVYFHPILESKSAPTFSSYILKYFLERLPHSVSKKYLNDGKHFLCSQM